MTTVERARALMAAATPGPWRVGHCNEGVWRGNIWCNTGNVHPFDERVLLNMNCHSDDFPVDADAALIAAAPELLAALCDEIDAKDEWVRQLEARLSACETCDGRGNVRTGVSRGGELPDGPSVVCPDCHGTGATWSEP